MHAHWILMRQMPKARRTEFIEQASNLGKCIEFVLFHKLIKCKFINLIHARHKNKMISSYSWKIINKMT